MEYEEIASGVFRINEYDFANLYLVVGSEKACLIDAGVGIGDIRELIGQLTQRPVTVLLTHAHIDHAGGGVWFEEVYAAKREFRRCRLDMLSVSRKYFTVYHHYKKESHQVKFSDIPGRMNRTKLLELRDGDVFDLGGRTITTYATPGHSVGSVCFRDSLSGIVFAGDNVNPSVFIQLPGSTTVKEWIDGARRTLEVAEDGEIYAGHGSGLIRKADVRTVIGWAEEIVRGGNGFLPRKKIRRGEMPKPCLRYHAWRVK